MDDADSRKNESSKNKKDEGKSHHGAPLSIMFPADPVAWNEARRLVSDKNARVESLAICASQDPTIAIELLRISNAMFFAGGKSPITNLKTAIVRLGSQVVLETLNGMKDRPQMENEDVSHWFEIRRARCKRVGIAAMIMAEAMARTISADCEAAGLLSGIGEMLAVAHFREEYVRLAEEHSHSAITFRLAQDHKFDIERMGLNYLRRHGIPEALLFAIDREASPPRSSERVVMRPICAAAIEMVEAFDANRWEKLAPGKSLPPKSAIRMLQIPDSTYLRVYERTSEYLFHSRMQEEKRKQEAVRAIGQADADGEPEASSEAQTQLQDEIQGLLRFRNEDGDSVQTEEAFSGGIDISSRSTPKKGDEVEQRNSMFSLTRPAEQEKKPARVVQSEAKPVEPPRLLTSGGNKIMASVAGMLEEAQSSEELLTRLMQMLVDQGPFEKSALIVVSRDHKQAIVVAARGPDVGSGQKLSLDDPLSPLAQCFSKVQSFGNRQSSTSPFGSKAFAVAPIDADHDTPVALYADCGSAGSVSFEARRVFRNVVSILNEKLPTIPGGIPVEI